MTGALRDISSASLMHVRKTSETPPRVSVYDVLSVVTGLPTNNCSNVWQRLQDDFPGVAAGCSDFRFPGQGQRETPVADAGRAVSRIHADMLKVMPSAPLR